jgi:hypothetical protein
MPIADPDPAEPKSVRIHTNFDPQTAINANNLRRYDIKKLGQLRTSQEKIERKKEVDRADKK